MQIIQPWEQRKPEPVWRVNPLHPEAPIACYLLNEGAGNSFRDARGSYGDGVPTSFVTSWWTAGRYGPAIKLDGSADYFTLPFVIDPSAGPFSVVMIVRFDSVPGTSETLLSQLDGTGTGRSWLGFSGVTGALWSFLGGTTLNGAATISTGVWYQVALTWDGSTRVMYLDGVVDGSDSPTPEAATGGHVVGAAKAGSANIDCAVDSISFWSRALSAAEIRLLYARPFEFMHAPSFPYLAPLPPAADGVHLYAELSGRDNGWTEITEDMLLGFDLQYGMKDGEPLTLCAQPGVLNFSMNNSEINSAETLGYYSLTHPDRRTGWAINIRIKLTIARNGAEYTWHIGHLKRARVLAGRWGGRRVECTSKTWLEQASLWRMRQVATQASKTGDQIFSTLVSAVPVAPPEAAETSPGADTYDWALDQDAGPDRDIETFAYTEFVRLAVSGYDRIFEKRTGAPVFSPRANWLQAMPQWQITNFQDLEAEYDRERVRNLVRARMMPRSKLGSTGSEVELAAYPSVPKQITSGEVIEFTMRYVDPNQKAAKVGGYGFINPPTATTDYLMNAQADGLGADLTADLTIVSITFGGRDVKVKLRNDNAGTGYIILFRVRGIALLTYAEVIKEARDDTTAALGENPLDFTAPWQSDENAMQAIVDFVLQTWQGESGSLPVPKIAVVEDNYDNVMTYEIGDSISLLEPDVVGLGETFWIVGIRLEQDEEKQLWVTYVLTKADTGEYFTVDVSTVETAIVAPG